MNRVLRPDGTLFISTPNIISIAAAIGLVRGRNPIWNPIRKHNIYGRHNKEYTYFKLMEFATSAGFKVLQDTTIISNVRIYYRLIARLLCALKTEEPALAGVGA